MRTTTVTLLASCYPLLRERAVAQLGVERPDVAVVRHELATLDTEGCVHRVVRTTRGETDTSIGVDTACCLSCLLRDDTLAALDDLVAAAIREVVVVLPATVEPDAVLAVLADHPGVQFGSVVVVVDADQLEGDLVSDRALDVDGPLDDDPRSLADVLVRQLEAARIVVVEGDTAQRPAALLAGVATRASLVRVLDQARVDTWLEPRPRAEPATDLPGLPRPRRPLDRAGVVSVRWTSRRPLHAARLVDAFEQGQVPGLMRVRGHLWVASRPATLLELEATRTGLEIAAAGAWFDVLHDQPATGPERRRRADAVWHPYWGDRASDLVLVLVDHDPHEAVAVLDHCLLTDEELTLGEAGWRDLPDPLDGLGTEADHLEALTRQET